MVSTHDSFAAMIEEDRNRQEEQAWSGSFLDYLEKVKLSLIHI